MPKYIIEREIPGASQFTAADLQRISRNSNAVLRTMGGDVQWLMSYVAGDRIYCIYIAPNEERIREHADRGGFPANRVTEVAVMIDPTTADGRPVYQTATSTTA
jgi:Protein of unknown function (DUF4242)